MLRGTERKRRRCIAHITAQEPPDAVKSVANWLAWRAQEDARMLAELEQQLTAHFEREAGATEH